MSAKKRPHTNLLVRVYTHTKIKLLATLHGMTIVDYVDQLADQELEKFDHDELEISSKRE